MVTKDDVASLAPIWETYFISHPEELNNKLLVELSQITDLMEFVDALLQWDTVIPSFILDEFSKFSSVYVLRYVFDDWSSSPEALQRAYENFQQFKDTNLFKEDYVRGMQALALNPNMSTQLVETLYSTHHELTQMYLLGNRSLPLSVMNKFYEQQTESVYIALPYNPRTPEHLLVKLYENHEQQSISGLLSNPSLPSYILQEGAKRFFQSAVLITKILENPNTPAAVFFAYADTDNSRQRSAMANNPSLPAEMFTLLKNSKPENEIMMTEHLAFNPSAPQHFLEELTEDDDMFVRSRAVKNLLNRNLLPFPKDCPEEWICAHYNIEHINVDMHDILT